MPTKADKPKPKEPAEEQAQAPAPQHGVLFQLEDFAVNGRKAAYEVLRSLLGQHKLDLTPMLFSRYCLYSAPQFYLPELLETLGAKKAAPEKLVEEATSRIADQLSSNGVKMIAGLDKVLHEVREREMLAAAITALPEATAQAVMARVGLEQAGVHLVPYPDAGKVFPGPNTWLKTAKTLALKPHGCAVLSGSMTTCKSALSADMRCVAVPDEFTVFQDFSGALMVLEALGEVAPRELLDSLFPTTRPGAARG